MHSGVLFSLIRAMSGDYVKKYRLRPARRPSLVRNPVHYGPRKGLDALQTKNLPESLVVVRKIIINTYLKKTKKAPTAQDICDYVTF
jgi:hypothetical protein